MDDLLDAAGLSKADVDRLGEAMRRRDLTDAEVGLYNRYRESFLPALDWVLAALTDAASPPATERQKTIWSTVAKLRRTTLRLSRVQDIAGCRVVVPLFQDQEVLTGLLMSNHPDWRLSDRRNRPSNGYRAAHLIAEVGGLPVEVQVRTELQHLWAEVSEAYDRVFPGTKYGSGPTEVLHVLEATSGALSIVEQMEGEVAAEILAEHREELRDMLRTTLAVTTLDVGDFGQEP
jgi:putative GTP pyrophosphokinase